jgi:hypothetical protein
MAHKEEIRKQLMDDVREKRRYWSFKEALDSTLWRTRFGIGCGLSQDRPLNDYTYIP